MQHSPSTTTSRRITHHWPWVSGIVAVGLAVGLGALIFFRHNAPFFLDGAWMSEIVENRAPWLYAPAFALSWVGGGHARPDEARLGYDVYDPAEIRALHTALARAGFALAEQGEVNRAHYALYRNAEGREVQINTPKRQGAAVGFVFYRQAAE